MGAPMKKRIAWIVGLVRSRDTTDVVGVFNDSGDPALWTTYVESISVCTRAGTPASIDSELRDRNLVRVLVPIETDGQAIAVLAIGPGNKNPDRQYSASDVAVIRDLCAQISGLLRTQTVATRVDDELERANDEREIVRRIQDRLLPSHLPRISGIECFGQCERSGGLGGDFFDLSGSLSIGVMAAIGDVAAGGSPGCILMTGLQVCLRSLGRRGVELPDLFGEANLMFWDIAPENALATLFSARVNPGREQLHYVNAGYQTSLIVRHGGTADRLEPNAPVLGLSRGSAYRQQTVPFEPGDTLIAVSDGITEPAREAALIRMVQHDQGLRVRELPARIIDLVESFAGPRVFVVHFGCASRRLGARFAHPAEAAA